MNAAFISGAAAVCVEALTFYWPKRREREADWRKMKLEQYRELIAALSGIVGSRSTAEARRRWADAVDCLDLVEPPAVLRELYQFTDHTLYRQTETSAIHRTEALNALLGAMRADIDPGRHQAGERPVEFRMLDVLPDASYPAETR